MRREIGAVAPVLAAAEEENLDRAVAAGLVQGDDVGVAQSVEIDVLPSLNLGQRTNAVADDRRAFVLAPVGKLLHVLGQPCLDLLTAARQEAARLGNQPRITVVVDAPGARRAATLDLI